MTLEEMNEALGHHDWWWAMSDDYGVWERGYANHEALKKARQLSAAHDALYRAWANHVYHGGPRPETV